MGFLLLLSLLLVVAVVPASGRNCQADEVDKLLVAQYPEAIQAREQWRLDQKQSLKEDKQSEQVYTIPVVIHVVYSSSGQNVDDEQILSQLVASNLDFRKLNANRNDTRNEFKDVAADTGIQFVLATTDPDGNPTNGINRIQTATSAFNSDNLACMREDNGGVEPWPVDQYLNIWVCNLLGNVLGFATRPLPGSTYDGVVVSTDYFGTIDRPSSSFADGRTTTHEIGHYLNLLHVWGSDNNPSCLSDDGISDTPNTDGPNFDCPLGATSCSNLNMVQNYMDYTDDYCMSLFTQGQSEMMRYTVSSAGPRSNLPLVDYDGEVPGISPGGTHTFPQNTLTTSSPSNPLPETTSSSEKNDDAQLSDEDTGFQDFLSEFPLWGYLAGLGILILLAMVGGFLLLRCYNRRG